MASMGRWRREYERDWQLYTRRVISKRFGVRVLQSPPSVTSEDECQLRDVLAAAGIKHVPPNHSRWQAPFPPSQTLTGTQDAEMTDESYVYCTPVSPSSQSVFPAFNSQDLASQTTPKRRVSASQRLQIRMGDVSPITEPTNSQDLVSQATPEGRVSASQRLQLRMEGVSPIAGPRRTSLEVAGRISPPSGAAKSPWTPGSNGKGRRTSLSFSRKCDGDDLDVSMQSMHLSDDEMTRIEEEDVEDTQMIDVSALQEDGGNVETGQEDVEVEGRQVEQIGNYDKITEGQNDIDVLESNGDDEDEDLNVSKALVFSTDSEGEDDEEGVGLELNTPRQDDTCHQASQQLPQQEDATERPPWASEPDEEPSPVTKGNEESQIQGGERQDAKMPDTVALPEADNDWHSPDFEFGAGNESNEGCPVDHQDAEMHEPVQPRDTMLVTPKSSTSGGRRHNTNVHSTSKRREITTTPSRYALATASSSRKVSHQTQTTPRKNPTSTTTPATSKSSLSRKRANRGALLHTKLPLEMEYRFASDRRRRRRRRKSLAAKPGVFPFVVPELIVELQPYQKEALQWMLEREKEVSGPISIEQQRCGEATAVDSLVSKICGGVLADEMGLGKTVCCLALICESLRQARAAEAHARQESGSAVPHLTPPTLIVTPLSILSQWEHEIRAKTNLSVVTYQGVSRKSYRSATQFMGADIVLSTYDTLRLLECKVQDKDSDDDGVHGSGDVEDSTGTPSRWQQAARLTPRSKRSVVTSKLHQLQWFRVILDESHLIANAGCARARAAFSLSSKRRWCVTGTPIQNRTADLAALLQFVGLGNRAHALSETELGALIPRVVMRRLKSTVDASSRAPILELPGKTEKVLELEFDSDVERALYMLLHRSTKRQVLRYLRSKESKQAHGTAPRSRTTPTDDGGEHPLFMHVFELILRLRQVCNACTLVTSDPVAEILSRAASAEALAGNGRDGISPFSSGETSIIQRLQDQQENDATNAVSQRGPLGSTKLKALMTELHKVRARRERVLVISQWTSFLDMVGDHLNAHNAQCETQAARSNGASESGKEAIAFAKLDGKMAAKDREQVVRAFQQQEDNGGMQPVACPPLDVLLLSLRTGGLGLNLTAASHVFIMEPSWNPSLERQAIDRAHRFGQQREVQVVRFVVKGSIEERVVALQNKKRQLTADFLGDGGILTSTKKNRLRETRLSTGDLRRLFFAQHEHSFELQDSEENHGNGDDNAGGQRHEEAVQSDGSVTCIEISE